MLSKVLLLALIVFVVPLALLADSATAFTSFTSLASSSSILLGAARSSQGGSAVPAGTAPAGGAPSSEGKAADHRPAVLLRSDASATWGRAASWGCRPLVMGACLCGFVLSLAAHGSAANASTLKRRKPRKTGFVVSLSAAPANDQSTQGVSVTPAAPLARTELNRFENHLEKFVPKIAALQNQAELLRSEELQEVLSTMKDLRKTELGGAFSEVDQLLVALVDAIDGLRESAQTVHREELGDIFAEADSEAARQQLQQAASAEAEAEREEQDAEDGVDTMMEVHVVGLSHHKAPVEVREKLAVPEPRWNEYSRDLVDFASTPQGSVISEVAVLSTCNRFELYFASPEVKKFSAVECVHAFLCQQSGLSREELDPYLFQHSGEDATQHLLEVSSGLDSLVLGEAQILAQVKACHEHSIQRASSSDEAESEEPVVAGSGGKIIAKMLNAGIRTGKLVRTRTKIGKGSVSVSSAAVELMMARALPDLRKYANTVQVCILGAGKMSRLLLIALFSKNPDTKVIVVNRSVDKAQALLEEDLVAARGGAQASAAPLEEMLELVRQSDVVFAATSSREPILDAARLQGRDKPVMLIDISVPRNFAADCKQAEKVVAYSVDDLKKVVQANAEKRQSEVLKAKKFIVEEVRKFKLWQASQGAVPYLAALQKMAEEIRQTETDKLSKKLSGLHDKEREAVDKLTRHIIDQLFRPIYYSMKEEEKSDTKRQKILALKSMFKLEPQHKRRLISAGSAKKPPELPA